MLAITALASCEAITFITAKDHKPEIQTPQSIGHFAKKHGFDGYPIVTFDTSIFSFDAYILLNFNMYNQEENYLSLDDQISGCPDKKKEYVAMQYILEHGDDYFIQDSVTIREGRLKDADRLVDAAEFKELCKQKKDTSVWQFTTINLSTHLNNYVPFFRTLEGEAVDI